jgi:hypothetical protein
MFSLPKISLPSFLRAGGGGSYPKVDLPSVEIHDIETAADIGSKPTMQTTRCFIMNYASTTMHRTFGAPMLCCLQLAKFGL